MQICPGFGSFFKKLLYNRNSLFSLGVIAIGYTLGYPDLFSCLKRIFRKPEVNKITRPKRNIAYNKKICICSFCRRLLKGLFANCRKRFFKHCIDPESTCSLGIRIHCVQHAACYAEPLKGKAPEQFYTGSPSGNNMNNPVFFPCPVKILKHSGYMY